ncbi:MAG TPA: xanthine dehydrogenase family protein molybdopterin-binding subunit [Candidatus Lustribacter sp.]|nr:xanthine dehydrogenase family protein molybdopterin-binding subunit [Candidatus Lustribacter sp.]
MSTTITQPAGNHLSVADDERRVEGREKVSGRTKYAADMRRPDTLWAAYAASPHPHARIRAIDVAAARSMPGVRAVLTGADIGLHRMGRQLLDWPVLAVDTVRFIGDRVAAVAAETREAAEAAARAIDVDYDVLPAVLDAAAALQPDAPVLHPDFASYAFPVYAGRARAERAHANIQSALLRVKGAADLEPVFARAHRVFEHRFETPRTHAGYIEPRATLVWIDAAGIVHVHSPNKSPFELRTQMARTLGLPPERIAVECTSIGGDFGGKGVTLDEFICYFLAKASGRPVRYVQTYAEELRAGPTRHHAILTLRTAVDADGTFLAHRSSVVYDGGAYAAGKPVPHLLPGAGYGNIPYRCPDVRLEMCAVYTNTLPAAHVRGPGETQTFFAWEQHVDAIAAELGIDPLELRLRNVITDGDTTLNGDAVVRPMGRAVLTALRDEIAALPVPVDGRGRGVSLICTNTGGGKTSVRMRLEPDATIAVIIGVADQGAGAFTLVQRLAAAALDVPRERIVVRQANTAELPYDPGAGASRITYIAGRAVQAAAEAFRRGLEERTGDAPVDVTVMFESDPAGSHRVPDYTFAAYAIGVAVDAETGTIAVTDAVLVADVGPVINPVAHRGQIDGGFACGFGVAMMEDRPLDESGKPLAQTLGDYKIPTIRDVPPLRTVWVPTVPGNGPMGAKMVGELSNAGVPPAIANAVYDAVGVRLHAMPLRAEDVYAALHQAGSEQVGR